jgi:hypothetical protein
MVALKINSEARFELAMNPDVGAVKSCLVFAAFLVSVWKPFATAREEDFHLLRGSFSCNNVCKNYYCGFVINYVFLC